MTEDTDNSVSINLAELKRLEAEANAPLPEIHDFSPDTGCLTCEKADMARVALEVFMANNAAVIIAELEELRQMKNAYDHLRAEWAELVYQKKGNRGNE